MTSQDKSSDLRVTRKRPEFGHSQSVSQSPRLKSQVLKFLFLAPLSRQKRALTLMAISLVFLSLSQTSLLLLVGPLLKSLFELGSTDRLISLSSLLPEGVSSYIPGIDGGRTAQRWR